MRDLQLHSVVPALTELTLKAPLSQSLAQTDVDLLTKIGGVPDENSEEEYGGLRKLSLTNNGHSSTQVISSQWTDDLALMTIALGQKQLRSLERALPRAATPARHPLPHLRTKLHSER